MPEQTRAAGGVGFVRTEVAHIELPAEGFVLDSGTALPRLDIAYETYGTLAPDANNAIHVCHALTGDAHAAGFHGPDDPKPGWWDQMIGPGKGIDTDYYFVVCSNILGGCQGTTGPGSVNPLTGRPYGSDFPSIGIGDMVRAQYLLLRHLGVRRLAAAIGGSMGGMQVLEWGIRYPNWVDRCICIASAAGLSTQALAFDIVGRHAILADPAWRGGDYYGTGDTPATGLAQARMMIGHITYLSAHMMRSKFGRERQKDAEPHSQFESDFEVERYLRHQGQKLVARFDANSYLHITRAMDEYDLAERFGNIEKAFEPVVSKFLVVALSDDWLFPAEQSVELANALLRAGKRVSYCLLKAPHGHDAFLLDIPYLREAVRAFLPWVGRGPALLANPETPDPAAPRRARGRRKSDFDLICEMIEPGSRVLDLGCGDGELLSLLGERRGTRAFGLDIDLPRVIQVIDRGHDVFQGDLDEGLAFCPDGAYDYALLGQTLQMVKKPRFVLREMLRVAREGIVSFPNFGKLRHRLQLTLRGRMPKSSSLPFEWYDTPNIHMTTLKDFLALCREDGIRIVDMVCIPDGQLDRQLVDLGLCGLGADRVLAKVTRK